MPIALEKIRQSREHRVRGRHGEAHTWVSRTIGASSGPAAWMTQDFVFDVGTIVQAEAREDDFDLHDRSGLVGPHTSMRCRVGC